MQSAEKNLSPLIVSDLRGLLNQLIDSNQKVLIIGLGISGMEAALFFSRVGIQATVLERQEEAAFKARSLLKERLSQLEAAAVQVCFGVDGERVVEWLEQVGLCVLSPGVSLSSAVYGSLSRRQVPCIGELELGVELAEAPSVVVTGSNGKSTVVSLIHKMLCASGLKSRLAGNVGTPVVAELSKQVISTEYKGDHLQVIEASSYQLESCTILRPHIAACLNISDNHLERHGTLQRYLECKARAFAKQEPSDIAIINLDDPVVSDLVPRLSAKVFGISSNAEKLQGRFGAFYTYAPEKDLDTISLQLQDKKEIFDVSQTKLIGGHNRFNLAVAILASYLLGATRSGIQQAILDFESLPHRLEVLRSPSARTIVNDSKSTTVAASLAALEAICQAFPNRQVSLMLGGLAKAGSWKPLSRAIRERSQQLLPIICFGQDRKILASHFANEEISYVTAEDVETGFRCAIEQSSLDDIILFSPGCASFDQFSNFEIRGDYLRRLVSEEGGSKTAQS